MIRRATPKLGAYAGLAALGLAASLALGRPEFAVLAAPFGLVLAVGLALAGAPRLQAALRLERERALEGEEVAASVTLHAASPVEWLEVLLALPAGLEVASGQNPIALRLRADERRELDVTLGCVRWGGYAPGELFLRARDPLGLFTYESRFEDPTPLRVYPRPERLRTLLPPLETQVFAGNQVARTRGEGIEFADIRPFTAGDRLRRVNWRASARRGELWVNEAHPERNTDVIVFLDTFAEARDEGGSTLDMAIRAAATLVGRYLQRKDRVGLVGFGGVLSWLRPGTGLVQLYRIVDALIGTEVTLSYAWKDVDVIPIGTLTPKALVVALTPLLDERGVTTLLDLRARGFDLAVVDVSPLPFVEAGRDATDPLAYRLWVLQREALRGRYLRNGVAVAEWRLGVPLEAALEEVRAFRRVARYARV